jgi:alkylation response protein AidB-like acyl-CoA dehydrogenase
MDLSVTDEHRALRELVRDFVEQHSSDAQVRRLIESEPGYDPAAWKQLGTQIGLVGLAIPEEYGGSGAGFTELSIVLEEMGRRLYCSPYFASAVLAAHTLLYADDESARHAYLPGIATGETIATLAWVEAPDDWEAGPARATTAVPAGDGWAVTGTKFLVLDGAVADLILVAAATTGGAALFAVRGDAPGLERTTVPTFDQTRRLARLTFEATPARAIAVGDLDAVLDRVLDVAVIALAAEQVGVADFALAASVEYAQTRVQFDRPIASFQAVKHRCAEMLVAVETARSAAYAAAWSVANGSPETAVHAAITKTICSPACSRVTSDSIQLYGGIGFTWEHPAHLYFKRARSSEVMFGTPTTWRAALATRIAL